LLDRLLSTMDSKLKTSRLGMNQIKIIVPIIVLMITPVVVYAQQSNSPPISTGSVHLTDNPWTLYNETSGSSSTIIFNANGTFTRLLHDDQLKGVWTSHTIVAQELRWCPDESKWMNNCITTILKPDSQNSAIFTDKHLDHLHLMR
jgi:hypothetical protein